MRPVPSGPKLITALDFHISYRFSSNDLTSFQAYDCKKSFLAADHVDKLTREIGAHSYTSFAMRDRSKWNSSTSRVQLISNINAH